MNDQKMNLPDLYRQQLALYTKASNLVHQILACFDRGTDPTPGLQGIQQILDDVARIQQQIATLQPHGQPGAAQRSDELKRIVQQTEISLRGLIQQVSVAEQKAIEAKSRLQPELAEATRRQQMRRAYQAAEATRAAGPDSS